MRQFATQPSTLHLTNVPNQRPRETQDSITRAGERLDRIERTGATFLITDLDLAMTLPRIAGDAAKDSEKRNRNQANARHAYNDVSRISHDALLTEQERHDVDGRLDELRLALEQLGEVFA